jgi:predicted PolB exonuclease-like 3'-5' exonuclease
MINVIVWDIETVPDLKGFAAANGHVAKSDDEVRAELGDKFPKHIYHSIICIGALVAHRENGGHWIVDALGAPHVGERTEKELIASFVDKIAALSPQLVTFNGSSFDHPVLRYRAMVHGVAAPGLAARPTCSTRIGFGYATSCFAGDCRMPSFRRARLTLPSS